MSLTAFTACILLYRTVCGKHKWKSAVGKNSRRQRLFQPLYLSRFHLKRYRTVLCAQLFNAVQRRRIAQIKRIARMKFKPQPFGNKAMSDIHCQHFCNARSFYPFKLRGNALFVKGKPGRYRKYLILIDAHFQSLYHQRCRYAAKPDIRQVKPLQL